MPSADYFETWDIRADIGTNSRNFRSYYRHRLDDLLKQGEVVSLDRLLVITDQDFYTWKTDGYLIGASYVAFLMATESGRRHYSQMLKHCAVGKPLGKPPAGHDKKWHDYIAGSGTKDKP